MITNSQVQIKLQEIESTIILKMATAAETTPYNMKRAIKNNAELKRIFQETREKAILALNEAAKAAN